MGKYPEDVSRRAHKSPPRPGTKEWAYYNLCATTTTTSRAYYNLCSTVQPRTPSRSRSPVPHSVATSSSQGTYSEDQTSEDTYAMSSTSSDTDSDDATYSDATYSDDDEGASGLRPHQQVWPKTEDHRLVSTTTARRTSTGTRLLLDLFSGCGVLSSVAREHSWKALSVDVLDGYDLTDHELQRDIFKMILCGEVEWVHMGPPCTTFCWWYRVTSKKNTRSIANPAGDGITEAEHCGNQLAYLSITIAELCLKHGVWFSLEQPRTSLMWLLPEMIALRAKPGVVPCHLVMCAYGCDYMKRTTFLTNAHWMMAAACKCRCGGKHRTRLQGNVWDPVSQKNVKRTSLAAAYPKKLCERFMSLHAAHVATSQRS